MNASDYLQITLITNTPELGTWFCEDMGCEVEGYQQVATFSGRKMAFSVADSAETVRNSPSEAFPLVLIRFVDVVSLQSAKELMEYTTASRPGMVLIYRNENEMDYKMSCPYCGQKLWVRDADQDKRGRCPHCHKGFTLPAQEEHVASTLSLPSKVPVRRIIRHDPGSLAAPLRLILEHGGSAGELSGLKEDLPGLNKNATMRVNVED